MPAHREGRPGGTTETALKSTARTPSSVTGTDAEVVTPMDRAAAERLDKRIRLMGSTMRENLVKIEALLIEAKAGQIHLTLGYKSWTGYLADALGGRMEMNTETRRAVVELLAGEGMSQRAIAGAVGVSQKTVDRDLDQVSQDDSPEPATGDKPDKVTGLDGRVHPKHKAKPVPKPKPTPRKPKGRMSRADRWQEAVDGARIAVETLQSAATNLNNSFEALQDVQSEYQDWYDSMPEGLQDNSPTGEKLQAVCDLDHQVDLDLEGAEHVFSQLDEAESVDLPLGWGRD